ncbi:unnamed protein product [Paramecium primaurelia]|uniref:Histidine ammonia-lyase n=1 Tax=Paramecium primaurelia TaxID=5886 RepID=A0A8S1K3D9_PARPR|nr:unnamed protein product [Paramecium primaurelia]
MKKVLMLDGVNLSINDLKEILQGNLDVVVEIQDHVKNHILQSRNTVDMIVQKKIPIYGISTGFGKFKEIYIPHQEMVDLQKNLIISHASCVGEPLKPHIVLVMMILRLNCLIRGFSGVRMSLIESLQQAINKKIIPKVPCQGSVGASGDLAPLSHLALGLMGIGEIWNDGQYIAADMALKMHNFEPLEFMEKEGLAMNNGTQMMAAINLETLMRSQYVMNAADLALGLTSYALQTNYHFLKNYSISDNKSKNIVFNLIGEQWTDQIKTNPKSIQTAFTTHQIIRQSIQENLRILEREINSTSDNPIIDNEQQSAKSGGNFHGEYMGMLADNMCIALQRLCIFSERRQERLVNSEIGDCGLPMFLTAKGGLLNGYMIPQYTSAALVSENKVLSHPSCIDTVPTSANIEDHVSMGAYSARKGLQIIQNAEYIIAIELMCAAQGLEFAKIQLPPKIQSCLKYIRSIIPDVKTQDIFMNQYIEIMAKNIRDGHINHLMEELQLL